MRYGREIINGESGSTVQESVVAYSQSYDFVLPEENEETVKSQGGRPPPSSFLRGRTNIAMNRSPI
jgi:hypothetical protein